MVLYFLCIVSFILLKFEIQIQRSFNLSSMQSIRLGQVSFICWLLSLIVGYPLSIAFLAAESERMYHVYNYLLFCGITGVNVLLICSTGVKADLLYRLFLFSFFLLFAGYTQIVIGALI